MKVTSVIGVLGVSLGIALGSSEAENAAAREALALRMNAVKQLKDLSEVKASVATDALVGKWRPHPIFGGLLEEEASVATDGPRGKGRKKKIKNRYPGKGTNGNQVGLLETSDVKVGDLKVGAVLDALMNQEGSLLEEYADKTVSTAVTALQDKATLLETDSTWFDKNKNKKAMAQARMKAMWARYVEDMRNSGALAPEGPSVSAVVPEGLAVPEGTLPTSSDGSTDESSVFDTTTDLEGLTLLK